MSQYDLIIRNGKLYDGSGNAPYLADIAVRDGVISAISENLDAAATEEVDAKGKIVTPGFVDVHTHYDGQATWDVHLNPSSSLGTTTVVIGNCGVGFAPCRPQDRDCLVELMEGVEEIPGTALAEGLPWTWESFPEFMDTLESLARDIDVAVLLPHGPLRVYVMGERGVNRELATDVDIRQMQALIKEGLDAGAVGFSTSRTFAHRSSSGKNVPTYQAATSELKKLGEVLSGEKGNVLQMISDWEDPDAEFAILRDVSEKTGAAGTFTLLQIDTRAFDMGGDADLWKSQLARIDQAQRDGLNIQGQVLSRPLGVMMGHPASMSPFYQRPTFKSLENLPWNQRMTKLAEPKIKAQILSEENEQPHIFVETLGDRFQMMYPLLDPIEYLPEPHLCVAELAAQEGRESAEWLYDFFLGNNGNNLVYIPSANTDKSIIPQLLNHPHTVAALGDGGAHVGSICDASANIYLLTKWVREQQVIDLPRGIRMLTREPAELFSLNDRGLLAKGMKADINIIDWDRLQLCSPHIVHDLPAGGKRFMQEVEGIEASYVSGEIIYRGGRATGALPGKLVRGSQESL